VATAACQGLSHSAWGLYLIGKSVLVPDLGVMSKQAKRSSGLADPTRLPAVDSKDPDLTVVIIETPKGGRNKYAYL
jgi:hypothetical protein